MKYEKWNRIASSLNRWPIQWWHYGRNVFFSFSSNYIPRHKNTYYSVSFVCVRCGKMALCLFCFGISPWLRISFNALLFAFMDKANTCITMKSEICVSTSSNSIAKHIKQSPFSFSWCDHFWDHFHFARNTEMKMSNNNTEMKWTSKWIQWTENVAQIFIVVQCNVNWNAKRAWAEEKKRVNWLSKHKHKNDPNCYSPLSTRLRVPFVLFVFWIQNIRNVFFFLRRRRRWLTHTSVWWVLLVRNCYFEINVIRVSCFLIFDFNFRFSFKSEKSFAKPDVTASSFKSKNTRI